MDRLFAEKQITCELPAQMVIVVQDKNNDPQTLEVNITQASISGARVRCTSLDRKLLAFLMRGLTFAWLHVPDEQNSASVFGRIVWIGAHSPKGTQLGLVFDTEQSDIQNQAMRIMKLAESHPPDAAAAEAEKGKGASTKRPARREVQASGAAPERPEIHKSSWRIAMEQMGELFRRVEREKEVNPPPVQLESRGAERIRCRFDSTFQFVTTEPDLTERSIEVVVREVSWTGARIRIGGRQNQDLLKDMKKLGEKLKDIDHGWLSIEHRSQKIFANMALVWRGEVTKQKDGNLAADIGLRFEGDPSDTKYVRTALLEFAHRNTSDFE